MIFSNIPFQWIKYEFRLWVHRNLFPKVRQADTGWDYGFAPNRRQTIISTICGLVSLQWRQNVPDSVSNHQPHDCLLTLRWRHNELNGVSDHQPLDCLLNRLFGRRSKKTSKFRVAGLCAGNSPGTGEFPAQMASNAENVSIWWRHHGIVYSDADQRKYQSSASLAFVSGNSPGTGEFPAQRASNAENVSIWWHHVVIMLLLYICVTQPRIVNTLNTSFFITMSYIIWLRGEQTK